MNLIATPKTTAAAGQSGQNKTVKTSPTRLSNIARYSASLAFFVDLVFPERWVRNATIVLADLVAESKPEEYKRSS